jgi:hypothetical protein
MKDLTLNDLIEVTKDAIENELGVADEPDDILEQNVHEVITGYADNAFTDLHEHSEDEIRKSFANMERSEGEPEVGGGGEHHILTMRVADKWCAGTFIKDFREMHAYVWK